MNFQGQRWMALPAALGLLWLLTGCATTPPLTGTFSSLPAHWQAQGKLGIKTSDRAGSLQFDWRQAGKKFRVELSGPLGLGRTIIESQSRNRIRLTDAKGNSWIQPLSAAALRASLGWYLPLPALPYWIAGMPAPRLGSADPLSEPGSFHQAGWELTPTRKTKVQGLSLPSRVTVSQQDVQFTVVIHKWRLYGDRPATSTTFPE